MIFTKNGQVTLSFFTIAQGHKFWHYFVFTKRKRTTVMENRKDAGAERRKRKPMSRPVLVRSERPGQVAASANYTARPHASSIWKEA